MGTGSSAGLIFGVSGGVMEAALRTAYYMINKEIAPDNFYNLESVRGEKDLKVATVDMGNLKINVAVVNTIKSAGKNYESLKEYDFVEVMTCPGGCIGGAGQPLNAIRDLREIREKRINSIYEVDKKKSLKESYKNEEIKDAYRTYINKENVELHYNQKTLQEVSK